MQLFIRCPHCDTTYQVDDGQLEQASGQVRCFHCNQVFNAMLHAQPIPGSETDSDSNLPDSREPLTAPQGIFTGPDDPALEDSTTTTTTTELDRSSELPELLEGEIDELNLELSVSPPARPRHSPLWWLLSLFLLVAAIAQLGWLFREPLLTDPQSRHWLARACDQIGCQLPPQRAPNRISVVERRFGLHPSEPEALQILLIFVNDASFAQPLPTLQITLFDIDEQRVAERRFQPWEYISRGANENHLLQPGETYSIKMDFKDPGHDVTGFELAFL